jgi:hypothetical protein
MPLVFRRGWVWLVLLAQNDTVIATRHTNILTTEAFLPSH